MTDIEEAVAYLYEVFARYPQPKSIEYGPCGCTKPDATSPLLAVSLRDLNFKSLEDYSFSAMTTQGSIDDFRYLLPRLFQGMVEEDYGLAPESLFSKLRYAKWMSWPEDEVAAIRGYLHAIWWKGLNRFPLNEGLPAFFGIESLMSSIAQTGEALEPYLNVWAENRSTEADEHLIQFVTMYGNDFSEGCALNEGFWAHSQPQAEALRNWLIHFDTLLRIENVAYLLRFDGFEHLFPPAFELLKNQGSAG